MRNCLRGFVAFGKSAVENEPGEMSVYILGLISRRRFEDVTVLCCIITAGTDLLESQKDVSSITR